jgi:hypothetical protein
MRCGNFPITGKVEGLGVRAELTELGALEREKLGAV